MRTFAYIRVSKERDGMVSPEIQADEIARHCERRGWMIAETFTDIDISGKLPPEKRPGLQELLSRLPECDMVVVYRVDRLSREPADYYAITAMLREAGVGIDAAAQPKDPSPESDLLWDLSAVLARYESLKLGARLKDMHRRIASQGRWSGGTVPYGWRHIKDEHGSRLVLEPEEAKWRRWMHQQYAAGWSCRRIAAGLNERAVPTKRGIAIWGDGRIHAMLSSPYQVGGRNTEDGLATGGNVEPLLTQEEYARTLALMAARHGKRGRTGVHAIPGSICRCGNCGGPLMAHKGGRGVYICRQRRQRSTRCPTGVSIAYNVLEDYVVRELLRHLRGASARRRVQPTQDLFPIEAELEKVKESLGKLAVMAAEGTMGIDEYQTARAMQRRRLEALQAKRERARRNLETSARSQLLQDTWEDLGRVVRESWDVLSVQARRDIIELVIDQIVVDPAKRARMPARERVRIRWR